MFKRTRLSAGLLVACGGVLLSAGGPAKAQDSGQQLERVTVTGSNIKRTDTETASPVQILSRDEIQRTGRNSISEVLQGLSSSNSGTIPGSFTNGFASGATGISLRGLGVNSTLVLVNGRRMATYGLADDGQRSFVDLNTIPLEVVDRIEVLKDGASAIYGSDAIAGVVNIILRRDYKGLALAAEAGQSKYRDGEYGRVSATGGFGDLAEDNYNVFITGEYSKTNAIAQNTRPSYLGTNKLDNIFPGYFDQRLGGFNPVFPGIDVPLRNSPYGSIRDPGTLLYQPATPCPETIDHPGQGTFCATDNVKYSQIQPEVERFNLFGRGELNINANLSAYAEAGYFVSKTTAQGSPSPITSTWGNVRDNTIVDTSTSTLPVGHPDNPFGAPARLRGNTEQVGGRNSVQDNRSLRLITGLKGSAFSWDYDTAIGLLQTKLNDKNTGYLRYSVLQEGYASGAFRAGFTPMDPAYLARLSPTLERDPKNTIKFVDFKASREIAQLPGGGLGLALGAEYRQEKSDTPPLPYTFEGDIVGLGFSGFNAKRNVYAFYGELNAPVLKSLELSGALRYDHYSDYGSSTTPKVGFKFTPISQLAIRGTYAEGFRAPGPAENGNSATAGFTNILLVTTGNPAIQPEESKNYTLGFVFEPIQGTSATVDFYRVVRKKEILGADTAFVVGPDQDTGTPNTVVPGLLPNSRIVYDDTGDISAVFAPYINGAETTTTGVELELRQRFNLGEAGRLTGTLSWTHIKSFKRVVDGVTYEYAGTHGPYVLSSAAGSPKDRIVFDLTWDWSNISATVRANYVSSMLGIDHTGSPYDPLDFELGNVPDGATVACGAYFPDGRAAPSADCKIPSFTTWDIFGRWNVNKQLSLSASVSNLFNKKAPWDPYTYGGVNYNPAYHQEGAIGRFFKIGAKYTF